MLSDTLIGALAAAALTLSGWAAYQVAQVPSIQDELAYIRKRVDGLYDHFIGSDPTSRDRPR